MTRIITLLLLSMALAFNTAAQNASSPDTDETRVSIREIYPNPFSGQFTVTLTSPAAGLVTIRLFDIIGNKVHEQEVLLQKQTREIIVRPDEQKIAEKGVYLLKVETEGGVLVERLYRK